MVSALRLNALLDDLDRAGLDAGPSARQQAHMLYMLLAAEQQLNDAQAERRLIDHLRPLIIRSGEQSAAFDRIVSHWGLRAAPVDAPTTTTSSAQQAPPQGSTLPKTGMWRGLPPAWIIGGLALLFPVIWILAQMSGPAPVITPDLPAGETAPQVAVDAPPERIQPIEPIVEEGPASEPTNTQASDVEVLQYILALHFMRHDYAPTLREIHASGYFGDLSIAELSEHTGLRPNLPLSFNEEVFRRLLVTAILTTNPSEYNWSSIDESFLDGRDSEWPMSLDERIEIGRNIAESYAEASADYELPLLTDEMLDEISVGLEVFSAVQNLTLPFGEARVLGDLVLPSYAATFSHDGSRLAVGGDATGIIMILDAETGVVLSRLEGHTGQVWSLEFSRDDRQLLSASNDNTAMLWNVETGTPERVFSGHENAVMHATFSNAGDMIATGGLDRTARVWSLETGEQIQVLPEHYPGALFADFSADDTRLLTASASGDGLLWNIETGEVIDDWNLGDAEIQTIIFVADDTRFIASSHAQNPGIFDLATGQELVRFEGHTDLVASALMSPDEQWALTLSGDKTVRLWDAETGEEVYRYSPTDETFLWADFSKDGNKIVFTSLEGSIRIAEKAPALLWPLNQDTIWTTADLAAATREALAEIDAALPERATDASIVRQVAALAHSRGDQLHIVDPPWPVGAPLSRREASVLQRHAPLLAALIFALIGLGTWLWSAFNMRAYLQRRRPGDPGRVIELFSDTRHQADKVQNAIRRAAKALLERQPGHERLDIKASIKATARARGLFTPVEKHNTRMPEYLFLIDARSRADHETQRALDYLDRLRKEHVPITHYFYERAPDRVRASMGAPAQSLDLIASEHSDKRLVLIGDAASMYASNRSGSGGWKKTLESWQSKSFVTTVPVAEWGVEERKFTQETGLVANVLSAEGLEALPTALFAEGLVGQVPTSPPGALDVPPLPALLRRDPERWILESEPDEDDWMELQTALVGYLGISGWRWLCACAVYPVIEWDLTVAFGQVLKGADKQPLFTESRAARLSELPWMRAGEMPDWLRARLIDEIDHIDREAVRELIARILEAVDREQKSGGETISLKFGYLQGREPDSDERFVDFVTRQPESMDDNALLATRKLRELLRPNILTRLIDPGALGWLVIGLAAALIAWLIAPRYLGVPTHTGAWAPLLAMLTGPVLAWLAWRGGKRLWRSVPNAITSRRKSRNGVWGKLVIWLATWIGLSEFPVRHARAGTEHDREGVVQLLRRRVEVWAMVPLVVAGVAVLCAILVTIYAVWNVFYLLNDGWLTAVRRSAVGDIVLTAALLAAGYFGWRALWRGLRRLNGIAVRFADRASLKRHDLKGRPGGRISRTLFLLGAICVSGGLGAIVLHLLTSNLNAFGVFVSQISGWGWFWIFVGSFGASPILVGMWHGWTLRRVARALDRLEQSAETQAGSDAQAAAA